MVRRLCISIALAVVLGLTLWPVSAAPVAMPVNRTASQSDLCHRGEITILPPHPRTIDPVSIAVSGWWGSSCPAPVYEVSRVGNNFDLRITVTDIVTDPPVACLDVVTAWAITHEVGTLPAGEYTVEANCSAGACWSFLAKAAFRVWAPTGVFWQYLPAVLRAGAAP